MCDSREQGVLRERLDKARGTVASGELGWNLATKTLRPSGRVAVGITPHSSHRSGYT
jgi:hypothetical protein